MADPRQQPPLEDQPEKGPSKSQILAVVTLLPVGGFFLLLAVLSLAGTLFCLAVTAPLFVLFSPILVPAALVIGFAVTGFLSSGAFGITALSSLSWIVNYVKKARGTPPEFLEQAKKRAQEAAEQLSRRAKEAGQMIQSKGQEGEGGRAREGKAQEGGKT